MSTNDTEIGHANLTFSQREGLEPVPQPLKLGELSREARSLIWTIIHLAINERRLRPPDYSGPAKIGPPWRKILFLWHVRILYRPADEFSDEIRDIEPQIKALVLSKPFNEVFDFLEFVMRHSSCPDRFPATVEATFKECRVAYQVVPNPPTIVPRATEQEGDAIKHAFAILSEAGLDAARSHLLQAAELLNSGKYEDSVRESIHAVESVARKLDPKASQTLSPALKALEQHFRIHPALKAGFEKIYGYTSDEGGIRHALLENEPNVDLEDAVFMIGACASFTTYLVEKARKAGLIQD